MATVDFTLDDIRKVVRDEFRAGFKPAFDDAFKPAFDAAFKPAFDDAFGPYAGAIQDDIQRLDQKIDDGFAGVNQRFRKFGEAAGVIVNGERK